MKKILTLLISAGIFTASYAQGNHGYYGKNDQYASSSNGRYDNIDHGRDDRYNDRNIYERERYSYAYQRQIQMNRINREYNYEVMSIEHNRFMTHRQKRLAIHHAKNERNYKIQMLYRHMNGYATNGYGRYPNYGNHDHDRDRR